MTFLCTDIISSYVYCQAQKQMILKLKNLETSRSHGTIIYHNLSKSLISRSNKNHQPPYVRLMFGITGQHISPKKGNLYSLLDLICPSMYIKYLTVYLFTRSYMNVDLHTISEEIFLLIKLHRTPKKMRCEKEQS